MKNQFVLEWSHKTNNFHVQPLEHHLSKNQESFIDNIAPRLWHVIFVGSFDAVTEMADHWRDRLKQRETPKSLSEAI